MSRLTPVEKAERELTEAAFQRQVCDLAELLGWEWCHWRPLRNGRGVWQVPVEGPLGKGWPDLTLVHPGQRRLIFAELKRELEQLRPDQVRVLDTLRLLGTVVRSRGALRSGALRSHIQGWLSEAELDAELNRIGTSIEVHVWRPSDLREPIQDSVIWRALA